MEQKNTILIKKTHLQWHHNNKFWGHDKTNAAFSGSIELQNVAWRLSSGSGGGEGVVEEIHLFQDSKMQYIG